MNSEQNWQGKRVKCIKECEQISVGCEGFVEDDFNGKFTIWFDEPTFLGDVSSQMWIMTTEHKEFFELVE